MLFLSYVEDEVIKKRSYIYVCVCMLNLNTDHNFFDIYIYKQYKPFDCKIILNLYNFKYYFFNSI